MQYETQLNYSSLYNKKGKKKNFPGRVSYTLDRQRNKGGSGYFKMTCPHTHKDAPEQDVCEDCFNSTGNKMRRRKMKPEIVDAIKKKAYKKGELDGYKLGFKDGEAQAKEELIYDINKLFIKKHKK